MTVMEEGVMPSLPADAKPHWELGEEYDLLHMDLGVKLTGAGFPVYSGQGAKLQRALISFFLGHGGTFITETPHAGATMPALLASGV